MLEAEDLMGPKFGTQPETDPSKASQIQHAIHFHRRKRGPIGGDPENGQTLSKILSTQIERGNKY